MKFDNPRTKTLNIHMATKHTFEHFDVSSIIVIIITVILFAMAIYHKGLSHDLLLEAGVFLVSVKLIQASYKSSVATKRLQSKLDKILEELEKKTNEAPNSQKVVHRCE